MRQKSVFQADQAVHLDLGEIVIEKKTLEKLSSEDIIPALGRHILGDWGKISNRQRRANQIALSRRKPVRSVYFSDEGRRFRVQTNAQRTVTTIRVF